LKALEARIEHLETSLEGLQDALYRHEVLQDSNDQRAEARFRRAQHERLV
jgi:hypothetical protein